MLHVFSRFKPRISCYSRFNHHVRVFLFLLLILDDIILDIGKTYGAGTVEAAHRERCLHWNPLAIATDVDSLADRSHKLERLNTGTSGLEALRVFVFAL